MKNEKTINVLESMINDKSDRELQHKLEKLFIDDTHEFRFCDDNIKVKDLIEGKNKDNTLSINYVLHNIIDVLFDLYRNDFRDREKEALLNNFKVLESYINTGV